MNYDDRLDRVERDLASARKALAASLVRSRRWEKQARDRIDYVRILEQRIKQLEESPTESSSRWWLPARLAAAACGLSMGRLAKARRAGVIPANAYRVKNKRRIEYLESAILSIDFWDAPGVS